MHSQESTLTHVEEEHAIQMDMFIYPARHSIQEINIPSDSQETSHQIYTHIFSLEVKMVEILTDLGSWKSK